MDDFEWSRDASTSRLRWSRVRTQFIKNGTFPSNDWFKGNITRRWWREHAFNLTNNSSSILPRNPSTNDQKLQETFDRHFAEDDASNVWRNFILRSFPARNSLQERSAWQCSQPERCQTDHFLQWQALLQLEQRKNCEEESRCCNYSRWISLSIPRSRYPARTCQV